MAQRRVEVGGEEESDPCLVDAAAHAFRRQRDHDAECLEDVGAPASRRCGAIPMLGNGAPRARGNQRCGGRDVEGPGTIAARPTRVHRLDVELHLRRMRPHRFDHARKLVNGLAPGAQRSDERSDLGGPRLAVHHRVHHGAGGRRIEGAARHHRLECLPHHLLAHFGRRYHRA